MPVRPGRFRLVYTGTLWNLTSIAPVAEALTRIAGRTPALLERLDLIVVGRKTPEQRAELSRIAALGGTLHDVDYCDHPIALATMASADALLLLLSDLPGAERVAPAKVFEYFATGRPILAVMPEGEIAGLVRGAQPDAHRTPAPSALTVPATSWPRIIGSRSRTVPKPPWL